MIGTKGPVQLAQLRAAGTIPKLGEAAVAQVATTQALPTGIRPQPFSFTPAVIAPQLIQEKPMGFFSTIAKVIGGVVGAVGRAVGILPAAVAPVAQAVARAAPTALRVAGTLATGAAIGAALTPAQAAAGAGTGLAAVGGMLSVTNPATGQIMNVGGGNGVQTTITMVQTIDNATGQIVRAKIFAGSPFLMNKEVAHLKSTSRKLRRGAARVPTRRVRATTTSLIKDAIEDKMLHLAQGSTGHAALPA